MKIGSRGKRLLRWLAAAFAGTSYLLVFACNSVLIPIPPPEPADPTFGPGATSGEWSVSFPADAKAGNAHFYIYNAKLRAGLIQTSAPDGSVNATGLHGQVGDPIEIYWYKSANEQSDLICRPLSTGLVVRNCE